MTNPFTGYDIFAHLASGLTVLVGSAFAFDKTRFIESSPDLPVLVILVVVAYALGHVIAELSSFVLERQLVRRVLGAPEVHLLASDALTPQRRLLRSYFDPVHHSVMARIEARRVREGVTEDPRGVFWNALPVARKDPSAAKRLEAFLNVYGFCRNMCIAFLTTAALLLLGLLTHQTALPAGSVLVSELCLLAGAAAMVIRYLKYYRLFTLEVLLTYQ